ncbi:MAG: hypothetical protein QNJ81_03015 [Acidimicrobiia bacterium]|nr:hypothetical protein [Acidimicrobiia bacterium]
MGKRWITLTAVAMLFATLSVPGVASASTSGAIAETGGMTLNLGVVGSPLDLSVTLDEAGHISEVTVGSGFTEERRDDHRVRFVHGDDDTRIDVRAKNDKLSASVKAGDLSAILGSHTWSGALFGADTATTVTFDVVDNGSGFPELVNVAVVSLSPADATFSIGEVKNEIEDDEVESSARITFEWDGYTMRLKIKASLEFEDDDDDQDVEAKLSVVLSGKDEQKLTGQDLADLIGTRTWDGLLCDGTPVVVTYTISENGTVALDSVTMGGAASNEFELEQESHGFELEFEDGELEFEFEVELKQYDDGTWKLEVESETDDSCHEDDDSDRDEDDHDDDDDDDDDDDEDEDEEDEDEDEDDDDDDDD